jgi:hypothetical protein
MVPRLSRLFCLASIVFATTAVAAHDRPAPRSALRPTPRAVALQTRRNERADITFTTTALREGTLQVDAQGGGLLFRKKVLPNGTYTLTLQAGRDTVALAFEEHTIRVTRGRKTVALTLAKASDDDLDGAQRLLADSRAARLLRRAAVNLQDFEDDSAEAAALLMADAVVGVLTGDGNAPARVARHLSRRFGGRLRPAGMQVDCYTIWEQRVYAAYLDLESCESSFSVWDPTRYLCAARFLLQAESYWFSFISCSGVPQF